MLGNHFFIITDTGIHWDSWVALYHEPGSTARFFKELGTFAYFFFALPFDLISPEYLPTILRIVSCLAIFGQSVIVYFLLIRVFKLPLLIAWGSAALTLALPFNVGRTILVSYKYCLAVLFFFLGLYLFTKLKSKNKLFIRLLSLGLFFISFSLNSLLVFYILLPIIFLKQYLQKDLKLLLKAWLGKLDFWLLPFLFWAIKTNFYQAAGRYRGNYNQINFANINQDMLSLAWERNFIIPMKTLWENYQNFDFGIVIGFWFVVFLIFRSSSYAKPKKYSRPIYMFLSGIGLTIAALFPYLAVGKIPSTHFIEHSTHQILLPLGFALLIFAGIDLLNRFTISSKPRVSIQFQEFFCKFSSSFILSGFLLASWSINHEIFKSFKWESFKFNAMALYFQENNEIRQHTSFLIDEEQIKGFNVYNRKPDFFEYSGLLRSVFGNQKRYATNLSGEVCEVYRRSSAILAPEDLNTDRYSLKEYVPKVPEYKITFFTSGDKPNFWNLFFLEFLDAEGFANELLKFFKVKIEKIEANC